MVEENERKIVGTIKAWTKEAKEVDGPTGPYFRLGLLMVDDEAWHNIPSEDKQRLNAVKESAPIGSKVEFFETNRPGSKYWNLKVGTWKLIEKGTGRRPFGGGGNYGYRETREELLMKQSSITILACIRSAAETEANESQEELLQSAKELLKWHNDNLMTQYAILNSTLATMKIPEKKTAENTETVPVETVNDNSGQAPTL